MYKGKVKLTAELTDNTISFAPFEFQPATLPGVERIELDAMLGDKISAAVHVSGVNTPDVGRALALSAIEHALDRLAFFHQVIIGKAKIIASEFEAAHGGVVPTPAYLVVQGQTIRLVASLGQQDLKNALEPPTHPGEHNFASLRSARLSVSHVEEFMHLYAILLWLFNDRQKDVDAFIRNVEPGVAQSQHPVQVAGVMETIYTRLRNELAHRRVGASIDNTKREMAAKVGNLRGIVREAIKKNP